MKEEIVLAISSKGGQIKVKDVLSLIDSKDSTALSNFIYDRLYGRYLKSFDYDDEDDRKNYKNGFLIMASCCLLIETYVSFTTAEYRDTNGKSGACFGYFFTTESRFSGFSTGGQQPNGKLSTMKQGGIPNDFYANVRCGILHNAETSNGWTISRNPNKPLLSMYSKEINAVKFANNLKAVLKKYQRTLENSDFDSSLIWSNFRARLGDLIDSI